MMLLLLLSDSDACRLKWLNVFDIDNEEEYKTLFNSRILRFCIKSFSKY